MRVKTERIKLAINGITVISILFSTGCASMFSKSRWPVIIDSTPSGATATITNKKGMLVQTVITPSAVTLSSKSGFFSPAKYNIRYEKEGYSPDKRALNANFNMVSLWNILQGGYCFIGFTVDGATGAIFKLDDKLSGSLVAKPGYQSKQQNEMRLSQSSGYSVIDFKIVEYSFNSKSRQGIVVVDIGDKGFQARLWVVKNIGMVCSSKNTALVAGDESFKEARYAILDESIKDGLLKINFEVVY